MLKLEEYNENGGTVGNIGPFEENIEQWSSYTERFEYFVLANKIKDELLVPTFLSVIGGKTFNLLVQLVQPDKPGDKSYNEIVAILKKKTTILLNHWLLQRGSNFIKGTRKRENLFHSLWLYSNGYPNTVNLDLH